MALVALAVLVPAVLALVTVALGPVALVPLVLAAVRAAGDVGDLLGVVGRTAGLVDQLHRGECHVDELELVGEGVHDGPEPVEVLGLEGLAHLVERELHLAGPEVGDRRDLLDLDGLLGQPLDVVEQTALAGLGERDRHALATGATHTADAVHVGLGGARHVVVDDVRELVDVEAAGGDVGRHEQLGGAGAEPAHDPVALLLVHAAVERLGAVAAAVERLGELVDLPAGLAEHDRRGRRLDVEDAAQRGGLVVAADEVGGLPHAGRLAGGDGLALDLDADRVLEVPLGDLGDPRRHRGREQHGLPFRRAGGEDGVDVLGEAHVEHLVGLVEHDHLHAVERERPPVHVVDGTARRGHHDVHAAGDRLELVHDRLAAVDRQHLGAQALAVLVDGLADLDGELTGGHQHERHRGGRRVLVEPLQDGQRERGGLAGAGRGLSEQVVAVDQRRDRLALDRRGLLVAEGVQRTEQLGPQPQVGEGRGPLRVLFGLGHGSVVGQFVVHQALHTGEPAAVRHPTRVARRRMTRGVGTPHVRGPDPRTKSRIRPPGTCRPARAGPSWRSCPARRWGTRPRSTRRAAP